MKRFKSFGPNSFKPKMKGGMPRMKKFEEGGDVEVGEGFSAAMNTGASSSRRRDDEPVAKPKSQSFSDAFREARKAGLKTFKWNGGTYGTKLKGEDGGKEVKPAASAPSRPAPAAAAPSRSAPASLPARKGSGYTRTARPQAERNAEYAANRRASFSNRALSPFTSVFGDTFGLRREEDVMRRMGVDRAEARRRLAKLDEVEKQEGRGMRRGGSVKKYASGGTVRGGGCEIKGKTRGKIV